MRRGSLATLGLVLLAVLAGGLAYGALRATNAPPPAADTSASPTASLPSTVPSPSVGRSGDVEDALPPVVEPPLLLADVDVAYRATIGSCLGGATAERTTDGGGRWRTLSVPAATVTAIYGDAGEPLQLIGASTDCRLTQWVSVDGGRSWTPSADTGVFSRLPDTDRQIATPSGRAPNPCPDRSLAPVSLEPIDEGAAAVLCDGGVVLLTADGGARWTEVTAVPGAEALAFDGPGLGWVLVRGSGVCPGYQLRRTVDGGGTWQIGGCLGDAPLPDQRSRPALSFLDTAVGMADLAGDTFVTSDAGLTWRPAR